ncbi:DUF692 domain-containing protein [Celerinatantimonas sp. YJH-8]|uniref:MNIO family bufferin maturase n=1 Tax=Celerinatantimonas sp. YJH-8 TaxID=3228714 RepID=UPI0038CB57CE
MGNLGIKQGAQAPSVTPSGISLKPEYYDALLTEPVPIGFLELHAENYLSEGGPRHYYLEQIRQQYPLTIHGVGLSVGGEAPLDVAHLQRVQQLVERCQPLYFSEHLAWSGHTGHYFNDLLPVIYEQHSLARVCEHVDQIQNALQQPILIENPARYLSFHEQSMSESQFLQELVSRTGCGMLLDINNVVVSCHNLKVDYWDYLADFPFAEVRQFHLAGHSHRQQLKIDSHDQPIDPEVWALFEQVMAYTGVHLTLIERDGNIPELGELVAEAHQADHYRQQISERMRSHGS